MGHKRRLVLLGAGHPHLETLANLGAFTREGHEVVVVAPGAYWYSGLATAMLGGACSPEDDRIDIAKLVGRGGGRLVADRVRSIDAVRGSVALESSEALAYDVVSIALGSEVPTWQVPGLAEHAVPVKPISNLLRLRDGVRQCLRSAAGGGQPLRVIVVGGGVTACEVAANLAALVEREGCRATIGLLARGDRLMASWPMQASEHMLGHLRRRGVDVHLGEPAAIVFPGLVRTEAGRELPYDVLVAANGLVPSRVIAESGLPAGPAGGLLVDRLLRSPAFPEVFGGGDAIDLAGHDLPRIGVHGVRQAPILRHNLRAALEGRPTSALRRFRPRARALQIVNLGDGTGLAARGGWAWQGRPALWLKNWIDHRYLKMYD